jgi:hypothetical protein
VTRYDVAGRTLQLARSSLMCVAVQHVSSSNSAIQLSRITVLAISTIVLFKRLFFFLFPLQHSPDYVNKEIKRKNKRDTRRSYGKIEA